MARTVQEIMNRELLAVQPDLPISEVRGLLRSFGVGAAPVLDENQRPIGVVSVRDVLEDGGSARDRMTRPAICVEGSTTVEEAARRVASGDIHHLIVVDGTGAAAGMLSTLDLLRAVLGMPTRHPSTFPPWDESTSVSWTDDWPLEQDSAGHAPRGAGVRTRIRASAGESDEVVWVEACASIQARVVELTKDPPHHEPVLGRILALRDLRFRAAAVDDDAALTRILHILRDRLEHQPPPGST